MSVVSQVCTQPDSWPHSRSFPVWIIYLLHQLGRLFQPTHRLLLVWCWFGAHDSGMRMIQGRWACNLVASSLAFVIHQQSAISNNDQMALTFHGKTHCSCRKSQRTPALHHSQDNWNNKLPSETLCLQSCLVYRESHPGERTWKANPQQCKENWGGKKQKNLQLASSKYIYLNFETSVEGRKEKRRKERKQKSQQVNHHNLNIATSLKVKALHGLTEEETPEMTSVHGSASALFRWAGISLSFRSFTDETSVWCLTRWDSSHALQLISHLSVNSTMHLKYTQLT